MIKIIVFMIAGFFVIVTIALMAGVFLILFASPKKPSRLVP